MNLVVVKILGKAGILYVSCLVEKCVFSLFLGVWFVTFLGAQLFVNWYLCLVMWRVREAEPVLYWRLCFGILVVLVKIGFAIGFWYGIRYWNRCWDVMVNRSGKAGILFASCLVEKCVFALSLDM